MRREVDATELDDVYVELVEERFGEASAEGAGESGSPAPQSADGGATGDAAKPS